MTRFKMRDIFILTAATVCYVTVCFLESVNSILLVRIMQTFDVDNATASWAISIFNGTQNLAGFILAPFVPRIGTRLLAGISGLLTFTGIALTSVFATSILSICTFHGILAGLGTCGMCICSVVSIQQHFKTSYSLPLTINLLLGTVGSLVGAPYMEVLSSMYGWRGAMLITAAICLHTSAFGLFLDGPTQDGTPVKNSNTEKICILNSIGNDKYENLDNADLEEVGNEKYQPTQDESKSKNNDTEKTRILNSIENDKYIDLDRTDLCVNKNDRAGSSGVASFVNIQLLRDSRFQFFVISRMLSAGALMITFQETPTRAVADGVTPLNASFLVSVANAAILVSRILASVIMNVRCVNRYLLFAVTCVLQAACTIAYSFCVDFSSCAILIGLCGIWIGSSRTVMRFLLYDVVSPENIASAEGWSLTATGMAELLSLPFAGWLIDITSDYDTAFYLASAYMVLSGICAFSLSALPL